MALSAICTARSTGTSLKPYNQLHVAPSLVYDYPDYSTVLVSTLGTSSWPSHCNLVTRRSGLPMQRSLVDDFDPTRERRERERARERPRERARRFEDLNNAPCRVRVVFHLLSVCTPHSIYSRRPLKSHDPLTRHLAVPRAHSKVT
jgi:hypothetical protein